MLKINQPAGYLLIDIIFDIFRLCGKEVPEVVTDAMETERDDVIRMVASQLKELLALNPCKQLTPTQAERLVLLIEEMELAL